MGICCDIYGIDETEIISIEGKEDAMWEFHKTAEDRMDFDKAWPEFSLLLSCFARKGIPTLNFFDEGGRPILGSDCDYGEARYFSRLEVKSINDALSLTSLEGLLKEAAAQLDPRIWNCEEITDTLAPLKDFIRRLSLRGKGMLIWFT